MLVAGDVNSNDDVMNSTVVMATAHLQQPLRHK